MALLVTVLVWICSVFGAYPPDHTLQTHASLLQIDNVESYISFGMVLPYAPVDHGAIYDECALYLTLIRLRDNTLLLQLERDCNVADLSVLSVYTLAGNGIFYTDY